MKTNAETKKEMYLSLEQKGITKKQVSISIRGSMYDEIVRATIQDIIVKKEVVEEVLKSFESIRWDEYAQEILQGCNIYVEVSYNQDKIRQFQIDNDLEQKALEIYNKAKEDTKNGTLIIPNDERFIYFPNDGFVYIETSKGNKRMMGNHHYQIMKVLTEYLLGHYETLEEYQIFKIEDEKRQAKVLEEYKEKQAQYEIERKERMTTETKLKKHIQDNSTITKCEDRNEIIDCKWAYLNKNATLKEYCDEVSKGDCYDRKTILTHKWNFKTLKGFEFFKINLLTDFEQLQGLGGTYSDDPRLDDYKEIYNVPSEIMQSVEWFTLGVGIYFNDKLMFVVDPQGHSYSRYVGLI